MKIVFPELTQSNLVALKSIKEFPDVEWVSAPDLISAVDLISKGEVDSMISGLDFSTREVVLACKNRLPLKSRYFSSSFVCKRGDIHFVLADGGVNKNPNSEQFICIVEDSAITFQKCFHATPKIALLSYSTHGSGGNNPDLVKYQETISYIKNKHFDWIIDGELQLDAAINPEISNKKSPDSLLKGEANVLIAPDLNSGNILYKSLEQFAGFTIAGPLIQGFVVPIADLSRGSTVEDTVFTIQTLIDLLTN